MESRTQDTPVSMICGLGNPGKEYRHTRHSVGFAVVDRLGEDLRCTYWKAKEGCLVGEVEYAGRTLFLVKPQSFMNTSGGPLKKIAGFCRVPLQAILVVHDDLELAAGQVRLKDGGGHGGHNGLRSISDKFASSAYPRLRCGIGRPPGNTSPADYVLRELRGHELQDFEVLVDDAARCALQVVELGVVSYMEKQASSE